MTVRGYELVTTDESTVVTGLLFDPIVMKDGQSDRCLADPIKTDESDGLKVFSQVKDLLNQLVTSETDPRRQRK